jgi:Flp pilus assembly protein TadD
VYQRALWTGVALAGTSLVWLFGCQQSALPSAPGALPPSLQSDVTPRLNASTYYAHGHLLERQGNLEQAVEQYREALKLSPTFVSARNRLGITLNKLGLHAEATAELRLAAQQAPLEAHIQNNLGFSLYLEGQHEEAALALQRAIDLKPEYHRAHMNRGMALARLERYDESLNEFRLATSEPDAYYNIAVVYSDAGRFADAARALETALQLNPEFVAAREQLHAVARAAAAAESQVQPKVAEDLAPWPEQGAVTEPARSDPVSLAADAELFEPGWAGSGGAAQTRVSGAAAVGLPRSRIPAYDAAGGELNLTADQAEIADLLEALVAAASARQNEAYARILCEIEDCLAAMQTQP